VPNQHRRLRSILAWLIGIKLAVPALAAIVACAWPLERGTLILACVPLGMMVFWPLIVLSRSIRWWLVGTTAIAVILSVTVTQWPLQVGYRLSRPAFDRVAAEVRDGQLPQTPCRLGVYQIRRAEVYYNGVVCLWTDLAPSGKTGFVQCGPQDPPFNLWSHVVLDDSWQFISED
jgi:hypothetical protein